MSLSFNDIQNLFDFGDKWPNVSHKSIFFNKTFLIRK